MSTHPDSIRSGPFSSSGRAVEDLQSVRTGYVTGTLSPAADAVPFDIRKARRFLKIRETSPRRDEFDTMIHESVQLCREAMTARYRYAILKIVSLDAESQVATFTGSSQDVEKDASEVCFVGSGLVRRLEGATDAVFYAMTLGGAVEDLIEKWTVEDFSTAFIIDGVASALLHGLLDLLENELAESVAASRSQTLGRRFAPGFHRWDLTQQKALFNLLKPGEIGMELSDSCVMYPRHSLTGVYGLFSKSPTETA